MIRTAFTFLRDPLVCIPTLMAFAFLTCGRTAFAARDVHQLQAKAERGFVKEEVELASAYFNGDGVAQDAKLAAYWYQKAAESGNPEAQNLVGYFYEVGLVYRQTQHAPCTGTNSLRLLGFRTRHLTWGCSTCWV